MRVLPCRKLATFTITRFWVCKLPQIQKLTLSPDFIFICILDFFCSYNMSSIILAAHPLFPKRHHDLSTICCFLQVGHLWLWLQSSWLPAVFVNPWLLMIKPWRPYGFKICFSMRKWSSLVAYPIITFGIKKRPTIAHFCGTSNPFICTLLCMTWVLYGT